MITLDPIRKALNEAKAKTRDAAIKCDEAQHELKWARLNEEGIQAEYDAVSGVLRREMANRQEAKKFPEGSVERARAMKGWPPSSEKRGDGDSVMADILGELGRIGYDTKAGD